MIQINLIPDVKQEFIRAQKMRNVVITGAILACGAAVAILVLLTAVYSGERIRENIARGKIADRYKELKQIDNLDNVLTIQNQMSKISSIHAKKTIDSRLFDLLAAVNPPAPNDVKISTASIDPENKVLTIEGTATNAFAATETFRKTILNTKLETPGDSGQANKQVALTNEVLLGDTSFGEGADGGRVLRFSLKFTYPDGLFDNTMKLARISTPDRQLDVTDSYTRVPGTLFQEQSSDAKGDK